LKALEDDVRAAIEAWVESQAERGYAIPPPRWRGDAAVEVTERTAQLINASIINRTKTSARV
jgi:hypothetical protein